MKDERSTRPEDRTDRAGHERGKHTSAGTAARPRRELSDYEDLQRRSRDLQDERAAGGPGTAQPPEEATPLLHPKPPKKVKDDD
jgi:hypothetical protein